MWVLIDRKWRFVFLVAIVLIISIGYEAAALHKEAPSTLPGLIYQFIASIFSAIGTSATGASRTTSRRQAGSISGAC
jgi:hypothetical protein